MSASPSRWYTGVEAARVAGVSASKISQAAKDREFPSERVGGILRIPCEPFDEWARRYKERRCLPRNCWYTGVEAARVAGVHPSRISQLAQQDELPSERVGGSLRIPCEAFDEWARRYKERRCLLTLQAAAHQHSRDPKQLKLAVDLGQVRHVERRRYKGGTKIMLNAAELAADLAALPNCKMPRCRETVLLGSRYCRKHHTEPAREQAGRVRRARRSEDQGLYYTGVEAARVSGLSPAKVCRAAADREFPSEKGWRGELRIPCEPFHAWLRDYRVCNPERTHQRPRRVELAELERKAVELWGQGCSVDQIARKLDRAPNTIRGYLDRAGIDRPRRRSARKFSSEERARLAIIAAGLDEAGHSPRQITAALGVSHDWALRLVDYGHRIGRDAPPLRAAQSASGAARCEHCGELFTPRILAPRDPDFAAARFCSGRCNVGARSEAYRRVLREQDLRSPAEATERLRISLPRVHELLRTGELVGRRISAIRGYPGPAPGWGISDAELDRFEREWLQGPNLRQRERWLDPDSAIKQHRQMGHLESKAKKSGLSLADTEILERKRIADRRRDFRRHKKGRKRNSQPLAYHLHWQERYASLELEIKAAWNQDEQAFGSKHAGRKPSHQSICIEVALEDWPDHPARWPRDGWPADPDDPQSLDRKMYPNAAARISRALKRLQNERTEIPAA